MRSSGETKWQNRMRFAAFMLPLSAMFEIARENTRSQKGLGTTLTKPLL